MKLSTHLNYAGGFQEGVREVVEMEKAGLDLVWVAEAYGFDSPSLMGYLAAHTSTVEIGASILPIFTRTPTLIAMTAAGIDALSEGRFHLGLGASGPQVIEGFHGVRHDNPLGRTREIVEICRDVWRREAPLVHDGKNYTLPLPPEQGTGLGRALKIIAHPLRSEIPIWIASLGEKNVQLTAEVADGWIPFLFVPDKAKEVFGSALAEGNKRRDAGLDPLMITAGGLLAIGDEEDVAHVRESQRTMVALYVGGMGAKGKNFYNELAVRYGFEREAATIQDLYLAGNKKGAEAAVPEELLRLTTLCGPASYVAERIAAFRDAGVSHLQVHPVPVNDQTKPQLIEEVRALL
jgi:F420-dependent oxidoreductase-like protein